MTYRGRIKNGALILNEPVALPEGAAVEVEVRPAAPPAFARAPSAHGPTWGEVFKDLIGSAAGLPEDLAENHDHYIHGAPKGIDRK